MRPEEYAWKSESGAALLFGFIMWLVFLMILPGLVLLITLISLIGGLIAVIPVIMVMRADRKRIQRKRRACWAHRTGMPPSAAPDEYYLCDETEDGWFTPGPPSCREIKTRVEQAEKDTFNDD
jgi:hypothetical protein